ncbi:PTS sugar transporter subunit IIA [Olsenella sp. AGMB03486]|jgi:PTS system fructose-specific IIA component|uniref:PTS sugar transporter subunit IIA n=1 Tax=Olsenella sp. AGMB03486 TaxID=3230364 RepID=UPI002A8611FD|nr:PTS sugar transporter subunit IIA [Olsenella sp.]MDY4652655.1 PTS sugar transporter subunit IIA [Atopobiaceae bacterium]
MDFVSDDQILLGREAESRHELLRMLCAQAEALGIVKDDEAAYQAFLAREELGATGLTEGFAVPHAKSATIVRPAVMVWKNKTAVPWPSFDEKPVDIAVALFVPEANREEHIRLLSKTAVLLMDSAFRTMLRESEDAHTIASAISDALAQE